MHQLQGLILDRVQDVEAMRGNSTTDMSSVIQFRKDNYEVKTKYEVLSTIQAEWDKWLLEPNLPLSSEHAIPSSL